jgi:hypothetical protein
MDTGLTLQDDEAIALKLLQNWKNFSWRKGGRQY